MVQAARKINGSSAARHTHALKNEPKKKPKIHWIYPFALSLSKGPPRTEDLFSVSLMQNTRDTQYELRDLDIELRTVHGLHLIAAAHRADLRGQHRPAGIFEALVRAKQWLLAHNTLSAHLLDIVIGVGDDPVAADEFGGVAAEIGDADGVGKYKTVARLVGLIGQVIYLSPDDEAMLIVFFHEWHLNRFFTGSQGEMQRL